MPCICFCFVLLRCALNLLGFKHQNRKCPLIKKKQNKTLWYIKLITKHPFDIHIFAKAASGEQRDSISVDCCIGSLPYLSPTHLIHSGPSLRLIVKLFLKPHNVYNPVNILSAQSIRFSLIVQCHGELIHRCQLFNIFDVHHASWNMAGFLRSLWTYRNYIIIVLTPLILLPLPLISPTSVRKLLFFYTQMYWPVWPMHVSIGLLVRNPAIKLEHFPPKNQTQGMMEHV